MGGVYCFFITAKKRRELGLTNGHYQARSSGNAQWLNRKRSVAKTSLIRVHGLRTPREEITCTARPKIHSHSQIFRYGRSIFCLPHRPNFSDIFDFYLHWVSVVRAISPYESLVSHHTHECSHKRLKSFLRENSQFFF